MWIKAITVLGAALLAGCGLAPEYQRPEIPVADTWQAAAMPENTAPAAAGTVQAADTGWRIFFTDAQLQKLIETALANNRDLRVAALNISRARGMYQIQRADLLPSVEAAGQSSNQGTPAGLSGTGRATVSRTQTVSVGLASYELDFFGRIQSLKDQALEEYLATEEAFRSAQIALVAEVAQAWLNLITDRDLQTVSLATLESQRASHEMIRRRYEAGISSELDLRQAQTSVDTARVNAIRYSGQVEQDINALTLLVGAPVTPDLLPPKTLDDLPPWKEIPVGLPSAVLLQRPDILQAEHLLKAANANIGAARANFFPRITLSASYGTGSSELTNLFAGGTGIWNFIPAVTLPLFEGGRNVARLRVSEADRSIAVANYEKAIQTAFREVADALVLRTSLRDQYTAQLSLAEATAEAYRLSRERYARGVDSYLTVLDSQRSMYTAQLDLISIRSNRELNQIQLYRVLGGGWKE